MVGREKLRRYRPDPASRTTAYKTNQGVMIRARAEEALRSQPFQEYYGKVSLIFTSPPFPLNRKKRYGNLESAEYRHWLAGFAPTFRRLLRRDGSVVMEMGNAWEPGAPVMSTLALETLLDFLKSGPFCLCQQFVSYNKARLPSPIQWVNVERIRVKDAHTHVWWMSPSDRPKADNRRVLLDYSDSMLKLLASKRYNSGKRPSEYDIGKTSFLRDNRGAIPSSVLSIANTRATDAYLRYCRQHRFPIHPARMPKELAEFFIKFLTDPGDLVLDPFAGSNVTGAAAEGLGRKWISIEPEREYVLGSLGRFPGARKTTRSGHLSLTR
jgi:site-specific DNA-methyltransferase (cytosine-N4-specific)